MGGRKATDETNNRYGKLLVIERDYSVKKDKAYWVCRCDCGKEYSVSAGNLRNGITKKCLSCAKKENTLDKGYSEFNHLFYSYKRNAELNAREFSLTEDEFKHLVTQNCHYCGIEPNQIYKHSERSNGAFIYNGIDRVDNKLGYITDNCVSCCKQCNYAKRGTGYNQFIEYLNRVTLYRKENTCVS